MKEAKHMKCLKLTAKHTEVFEAHKVFEAHEVFEAHKAHEAYEGGKAH